MKRDPQTCQTALVMTSDPATLVAMLYDKVVSCLKAAAQAIHNNEIETRWKNNHRAQEIINHLFMTLDLERGGEVASNLEALYSYMLLRLPDIDVNNDARVAEEVIELIEPLRASWNELARSSADIKMDQREIDAIAAVVGDAEYQWIGSGTQQPLRHAQARFSTA
ncbi:MAG: flagellar export chaperone FliS [Alphaproteobacteria bacterium]